MDVYELALKMETEGEKYYKRQAELVSDEGLKSIFEMLANDERKHYEIVQNIKENIFDTSDLPEIKNTKTIFTERLKSIEEFDPRGTNTEAYDHAKKLELDSINFYEDRAKETDNPKEKEVLLKLAKEERKHYEALDYLIDHVRKSQRWLEDARFNNMEEY